MKKELLANAAVTVLAACALVVTGLVVRRELFLNDPAVQLQARESTRVANWREYAAAGHVMGNQSAPVTVVVFSDFQCPACRMLADSLHVLRRNHPGSVRVVYRHFPLQSHRYALTAAGASECAAAQGRFEAFHDALFARQQAIGEIPWSDFAKGAAVPDLARFDACVREAGAVPAVSRDQAMGDRLGVNSTPTLLVNDTRIEGARPLAALERYVERARRARN
jgi:protein-disulfide isomerase